MVFYGIGANTNPLYRIDAMYVTCSILHKVTAVKGFLYMNQQCKY